MRDANAQDLHVQRDIPPPSTSVALTIAAATATYFLNKGQGPQIASVMLGDCRFT